MATINGYAGAKWFNWLPVVFVCFVQTKVEPLMRIRAFIFIS